MLEGVAIVGDIVIVIVGIGEKVVACGEDIAGRQIGGWQLCAMGILDDEEVLVGIVAQILAQLVAQVGVGVAVAYNLHGVVGTDGAVVGGDDDAIVGLRKLSEQVADDAVTEP